MEREPSTKQGESPHSEENKVAGTLVSVLASCHGSPSKLIQWDPYVILFKTFIFAIRLICSNSFVCGLIASYENSMIYILLV